MLLYVEDDASIEININGAFQNHSRSHSTKTKQGNIFFNAFFVLVKSSQSQRKAKQIFYYNHLYKQKKSKIRRHQIDYEFFE